MYLIVEKYVCTGTWHEHMLSSVKLLCHESDVKLKVVSLLVCDLHNICMYHCHESSA